MTTSADRRGFTLIELLVVITVILVLVGLLMGGLHMLQRQRKRVETMTVMKQLSTALTEYLATYPLLGAANDSSDFVASPWTFLGRNPIAAGSVPYMGDVLPRFLACGTPPGPYTAGTEQTADQILDAFSTADHSNIIGFVVMNNAGSAGRYYTNTIYIRSTAGTPTSTGDDIVMKFVKDTGQWTTETYQDSQSDSPAPTWP